MPVRTLGELYSEGRGVEVAARLARVVGERFMARAKEQAIAAASETLRAGFARALARAVSTGGR